MYILITLKPTVQFSKKLMKFDTQIYFLNEFDNHQDQTVSKWILFLPDVPIE